MKVASLQPKLSIVKQQETVLILQEHKQPPKITSIIYFISQANITVIQTLHQSSSHTPSLIYNHFAIVIAFEMMIILMYHHPEKFSVLCFDLEQSPARSLLVFFCQYGQNFHFDWAIGYNFVKFLDFFFNFLISLHPSFESLSNP